MHTPVLLNETMQQLALSTGEFAIDGTLGGGGHALELLKRVLPTGRVLGVDWDENFLDETRARLVAATPSLQKVPTAEIEKHLILVNANYSHLVQVLQQRQFGLADTLLLDLGFSSQQLEDSGRGFSFQKDEPLLMTYSDAEVPVRNLLRQLSEKELADALYQLGGERRSRRIAQAIKEHLRRTPIETTQQLREVIVKALPRGYEHGRIDPATRTFQALRILANHELENLAAVLNELPRILKPGGRVAIITFHSLEDKIVKDHFRALQKAGQLEILTKKPIAASREEVRANPRSRSAKLRAAKML